VRSYLRAGAARVGVSGVRSLSDSADEFFPGEQLNQRGLLDKITRIMEFTVFIVLHDVASIPCVISANGII